MKTNLSKAFLIALISTPLLATTPPKVLLQAVTAGGFTPVPMANGIRVLENGVIAGFKNKTNEEVGRLTLEKVKDLQKIVDGLAGDLVDSDAGKPMCADAPTTTYTVNQSNGKSLIIAQQVNCHRYSLQGQASGRADSVKRAIDGLNQIYFLK